MSKYTVLISGLIRDNETNTVFPQSKTNNDFLIFENWKNGIGPMGNQIPKGVPDYEEDTIALTDVQNSKILELKTTAQRLLSETDWYVIRAQETLKNVPPDIVNLRKSIRSYASKAEKEIKGLRTKDMVKTYVFKFPA